MASGRGSKPGERRGGRKRGTPNKTTATVRANVLAVFDDMGGIDEMTKWASDNQTEFYKIYARLIPQEHSGPEGGPIPVAGVSWDWGNGRTVTLTAGKAAE